MSRRDFLKGFALAGAGAGAGLYSLSLLKPSMVTTGVGDGTKTAEAMSELIEMIARKDASFDDLAWRLLGDEDTLAEARLLLLHTLNHALDVWLAADPARPAFRRWHFPDKKLFGDNPDAIYYETPVSAEYAYRITGNVDDATYTSFSVELEKKSGDRVGKLGATLNDSEFEIASDGSYEIVASATRKEGNWLELAPEANSITTRHYFELEDSVALDLVRRVPLVIEPLEPPAPAPPPTDASVAASIRRVTQWLDKSVNPLGQDMTFSWVSKVPNQLPAPSLDSGNEDIGYAALDNVYSMAPFLLKPHQALVIRGRWPKCRFANIVLWNRFLQTFDYRYRTVSRNRKQTTLEKDGSFKMIVAHEDPGLPNWLDTEGRMLGLMFWRFQLPEEEIEPLTTEVVSFASLQP
ncbi:MAG: DUF1214 domain-containing protein [Deltaproteobacteria bacterium]|nr:DUF1214 domain-containing protein [Deltaproteobacteria bacterium]